MFSLHSPRSGVRSTISRRRHRRPRRFFATLVVVALFGWVAWSVHQTTQQANVLDVAKDLLNGNIAADQAPDPRAAIEVLTLGLARNPDDYDAYMLRARAWARLQAWDKARNDTERAYETAETDRHKILSLRIMMDYQINANEYDGAVEVGERMVSIDNDPLRKFHLGVAYYKGSKAAQSDALAAFTSTVTTSHELEVAKRVESYITKIIVDADLDELMHWLLPDSDPVLARRIRNSLIDSRERYLAAIKLLEPYRFYGGYDGTASEAYSELMLRSGRMFEAFLESDISLREPGLPVPTIAFYEEIKATVLEEIGFYEGAGDRYQAMVDVAERAGRRVRPEHVAKLYENRLKAEQWLWILEHANKDLNRYNENLLISLARSQALLAAGKASEAIVVLQPLYSTLNLGTAGLLPPYLRASPEMRREIVVTAYRLFSATEDRRALAALEWILAEFPNDRDARKWRIEYITETYPNDAVQLEVAVEDAFALMRGPRRQRVDFERWLELSETLSMLRHGKTVVQRAAAAVSSANAWGKTVAEARFARQTAGRRIDQIDSISGGAMKLYYPDDTVLSVEITRELIEARLFTRARNQCRRLVEQFPDVHQLRYILARLLVREGRLDSALTEFRDILKAVPSDTESLDFATRILIALGRHEDAADLVNQMIVEDPQGVGAERFGMRLLAKGDTDQVDTLVERLRRANDGEITAGMLMLSTRAALGRGDFEKARAQLTTLAQLLPKSLDVAEIALQIGHRTDNAALLKFALEEISALAPGLFPDQMRSVPDLMISLGMTEELLAIFDEPVRSLPAAQPALRPLALAAKSLGRLDEADELLDLLEGDGTLLDNVEVVIDRFLLASVEGKAGDAAHRLRLESVRPELRNAVGSCLLVASALQGHESLLDNAPMEKLDNLGLDDVLAPRDLEFMDALLRLAPHLGRLDVVLPRAVVENPRAIYPVAHRDVALMVDLARKSPDIAREVLDSLVLLMLMSDRSFWVDERRFLAERLRTVVPNLGLPSRVLARSYLELGRPEEAMATIEPMMRADMVDADILRVFIDAAYAYDKGEWGIAVGLLLQETPVLAAAEGAEADPETDETPDEVVADFDGPHLDMRLALADALVERGHAREALPYFLSYLDVRPNDAAALRGAIAAYGAIKLVDPAMSRMEYALPLFPFDEELADTCISLLVQLFQPDERALALMESLAEQWPDDPRLPEALARAANGDAERIRELLTAMLAIMEANPVPLDSEEAQIRSALLVRGSQTARLNELIDVAYDVTQRALRLDPGSIIHVRELALLELERGNLDLARRYLEALRFIDTKDREGAMTLAQLYFEEIGEPMRAAEVVDATFLGNMPPEATKILAARTYLQGDGPGAIAEFTAIIGSPLITEYTIMSVARIAYASGQDDAARTLLDQALSRIDETHEVYGRANYLRGQRIKK